MPKGHVEARTVVCRQCGSEFVTTKVGKASFFCRSEECDLSRGGAPAARIRRLRAKEAREREREAQAARERQEAVQARERARDERLRLAREEREAKRLARLAENHRELFDPIRECDEAMLLFDELMAAAL